MGIERMAMVAVETAKKRFAGTAGLRRGQEKPAMMVTKMLRMLAPTDASWPVVETLSCDRCLRNVTTATMKQGMGVMPSASEKFVAMVESKLALKSVMTAIWIPGTLVRPVVVSPVVEMALLGALGGSQRSAMMVMPSLATVARQPVDSSRNSPVRSVR